MKTKKLVWLLGISLLTLGLTSTAFFAPVRAEDSVRVNGAAMYTSKTIVDNIVNSADHTTLVSALKAADLVETLKGTGPFTVFAPTNKAFDKLAPGTLENLLKPENKAKLASILTYHVVPGRFTAADLAAKANTSGGKAILKTVEGGSMTVMKDNSGKWWATDSLGGKAVIATADVIESNGVIHVIDTVLMPK